MCECHDCDVRTCCIHVLALHYVCTSSVNRPSDAYPRRAKKYKACGQWFVVITSPWVHLAHKQQLRNTLASYALCQAGGFSPPSFLSRGLKPPLPPWFLRPCSLQVCSLVDVKNRQSDFNSVSHFV